jgi:hypothetical protein
MHWLMQSKVRGMPTVSSHCYGRLKRVLDHHYLVAFDVVLFTEILDFEQQVAMHFQFPFLDFEPSYLFLLGAQNPEGTPFIEVRSVAKRR